MAESFVVRPVPPEGVETCLTDLGNIRHHYHLNRRIISGHCLRPGELRSRQQSFVDGVARE